MNEGIDIVFEDVIDEKITSLQKEDTLVIYTPAIKTLGILDYFNQNQFEVLKRAKVLGLITENTDCIAVAGTHGKQQLLPWFHIYAKKQIYLSHVFRRNFREF
jgi:UDP-N-acetylmuramate--alanine ligase